MFDNQFSKKVESLLEYIEDGGKTRHDKENTKEFKEQLDAHTAEFWSNAEYFSDGSIIVKPTEDDDEKYPLLQWTKEEEKISKEEVEQEIQELSTMLAEWFKQNKELIPLFAVYLDVWSHSYARHGYAVSAPVVAKQIKQTSQDLINGNWQKLLTDFHSFIDWWD